MFTTIHRSKLSKCELCHLFGATILCSYESCDRCFHFPCASKLGWKYDVSGSKFYCLEHKYLDAEAVNDDVEAHPNKDTSDQRKRNTSHPSASSAAVIESSDDESKSGVSSSLIPEIHDPAPQTIDIQLTAPNTNLKSYLVRLGRLSRETVSDLWNVSFFATTLEDSSARVLSIASTEPDPINSFEVGDMVRSVNGYRIGSREMDTLHKFFKFLNQQVEVLLEIRRIPKPNAIWD